MQGVLEQGPGIGDLHDLANIHHRDPVTDMLDHSQIMRDEKQRKVELFLQIDEQIDDLRLNRDVKCRDRFISNNQGRIECQCAGDAKSLTLPARELMGVPIHSVGFKPYLFKQSNHPLLDLRRAALVKVLERFADKPPRRKFWVEGGIRILKHHLHLAAVGTHLGSGNLRDIGPLEIDLSTGRFEQPQHHSPHRRLTAAALTHQSQCLTPGDVEADSVNGIDRT